METDPNPADAPTGLPSADEPEPAPLGTPDPDDAPETGEDAMPGIVGDDDEPPAAS